MKTLSVDQQAAISKLKKLRVGALFMEPGTGKTRTAIELINSSDTDFVLWIVPFQTKDNLNSELNKWGFSKDYRIEGVESLSSSGRLYLELIDLLKSKKKPFCVVDESLKIKNRKSIRTKRTFELGKLCYYRLILNGTPISKNILDLWMQLEFLSPKILKMDFLEFKDTFVEYTEIKTSRYKRQIINKPHNMEYLYSLIKPYVFDAELDLEITQRYKDIRYYIEDKTSYEIAKHNFLSSFSYLENDISFLANAQKMQQSYALDLGKRDALKELLYQIDEDVIIFCKFLSTKRMLETIKRENDLILTYGKGSLGLNLQHYKTIIFYEKTWDYAKLEQAKRRVYRTGQTENVNFYMFNGDVGLENMMNKSIEKKINILDLFKQATKEELEDEL